MLSSGCSNINAFIGGGFLINKINQISGCSGTGKTQLCLQLCLLCQLPHALGGTNAGCVYITTTQKFQSSRLIELIPHMNGKFGGQLPENPLDNIFVEHCTTVDDLITFVGQRLPCLLNHRRIGLIIIDDIASLFRHQRYEFYGRNIELSAIANALRTLTKKQNICIIVVNQMTFSTSDQMNSPSLGQLWRKHVDNQISIERNDRGGRYLSLINQLADSSPSKNRLLPIQIERYGVFSA